MRQDLTKNPKCYVNKIANMNPTPQQMFYDQNTSFEDMQTAVAEAVYEAKDTAARVRFLYYLYEDCFTKQHIEQLCANAVAKGKNYQG
jgi:hypothetical protein